MLYLVENTNGYLDLQMSKSFVIGQTQSAVSDIIEGVENRFTDDDYLDVEEPGYFVTKIDQVCCAVTKVTPLFNIHSLYDAVCMGPDILHNKLQYCSLAHLSERLK